MRFAADQMGKTDAPMTSGRFDIAPGFSIGENEVSLSFVRASGPGGQNVNKVASAVQIRFDAANSPEIDAATLARLATLAGRRMTAAGVVVIAARRFRTQEANRRDAIERLVDLLRAAWVRPRRRRPTKPGRAAKERRLDTKSRRSGVKRMRGRVRGEDG
jgi:ribosome-associated protein